MHTSAWPLIMHALAWTHKLFSAFFASDLNDPTASSCTRGRTLALASNLKQPIIWEGGSTFQCTSNYPWPSKYSYDPGNVKFLYTVHQQPKVPNLHKFKSHKFIKGKSSYKYQATFAPTLMFQELICCNMQTITNLS